MTMTLAGFAAAVAAHARALPGIKAAPDFPPEAIHQYPFAITYPKHTTVTGGANPETKRLITMICDIHVSRQILPTAVETAITYGDTFPIALWNDVKLGGSVNHVNEVRGDFVNMEYAKVATIGWRFEIDAKQEDG